MITKEEYELAQQVVWDYEDQITKRKRIFLTMETVVIKNNILIEDFIKKNLSSLSGRVIQSLRRTLPSWYGKFCNNLEKMEKAGKVPFKYIDEINMEEFLECNGNGERGWQRLKKEFEALNVTI